VFTRSSGESLSLTNSKIEQREILAHALTVFIPFWAQTSPQHAQNISRLEDAQKHHSLVEEIPKMGADDSTMDVAAAVQIEAVLDLPFMHTRAALFIFLNSLVGNAILFCPINADNSSSFRVP